jgi:regulator of nucleoside diphosphate kinase
MSASKIMLTELDRCRLGTLLSAGASAGFGGARSRYQLEQKLDDAEFVSARQAPQSLVTMNSRVQLIDLATGQSLVRTLVYPEDQDLFFDGVSVLQELGRRLLGRRQGEVIQVEQRGKIRWYKIAAIVYQPEEAGELRL